MMFKVMVYGYQCGIYSSRKLEEACKYRIDFKWLLEDRKNRIIRHLLGSAPEDAWKLWKICFTSM